MDRNDCRCEAATGQRTDLHACRLSMLGIHHLLLHPVSACAVRNLCFFARPWSVWAHQWHMLPACLCHFVTATAWHTPLAVTRAYGSFQVPFAPELTSRRIHVRPAICLHIHPKHSTCNLSSYSNSRYKLRQSFDQPRRIHVSPEDPSFEGRLTSEINSCYGPRCAELC
jgi:hypothetical protein